MSLSRRDEIRVGIEPGRIVLVRPGRRRSVALIEAAGEAAFAQLASTLAEPEWQGRRAQIVLSDRLVNYAVIERPIGVANAEELMQAIQGRCSEIFGDRDVWSVSADLLPFARRDLACCVPAALLERLHEVFAAQGVGIDSLQPHLIASFNRLRRRLGRAAAWFVVLEPDSVAIALIAAGGFCGVRVQARSAAESLAAHLARAQLQFDESATRCFVVAASGDDCVIEPPLELLRLDAVVLPEAPLTRIALAGVAS